MEHTQALVTIGVNVTLNESLGVISRKHEKAHSMRHQQAIFFTPDNFINIYCCEKRSKLYFN